MSHLNSCNSEFNLEAMVLFAQLQEIISHVNHMLRIREKNSSEYQQKSTPVQTLSDKLWLPTFLVSASQQRGWSFNFLSLLVFIFFIILYYYQFYFHHQWTFMKRNTLNEVVKLSNSLSRTLFLATDMRVGLLINLTYRAEFKNSSSPLSVTQRYPLVTPAKP